MEFVWTLKGIIYDGKVFNSVELSLIDPDRKENYNYYDARWDILHPKIYIFDEQMNIKIQQFINDIKTVAKGLFEDKQLLVNYLRGEFRPLLGQQQNEDLEKSFVLYMLSQFNFKGFDYSWYEGKIINFYIGVLNSIIYKRRTLIFDEKMDVNARVYGLEELKGNIELIINNNFVAEFEIDGKKVFIPHINDVLRKHAQEIKEQLEKDILVVANIDKEEEKEYLLAEDVYEKRQRLWGFLDSKLQEKMERDFQRATDRKEKHIFSWGPVFRDIPSDTVIHNEREVEIDGKTRVVTDIYKLARISFSARYEYYADRILQKDVAKQRH